MNLKELFKRIGKVKKNEFELWLAGFNTYYVKDYDKESLTLKLNKSQLYNKNLINEIEIILCNTCFKASIVKENSLALYVKLAIK